ncbi:MAG: chromate resistance protein ChrB domain-containing protein [Gemmatimonadota bacterium]
MSAADGTDRDLWLLLIHQIPPKPDYLRVKIGRRVQRIGAVAVKNSVYVLPDRSQSLEDFQWVRAEVIEGGGDASICRASFMDGLTDDQIRHLFRAARDTDYASIAESARDASTSARPQDELARLRKRLSSIISIDFFGAEGRADAESALRSLEKEAEPTAVVTPTATQEADRGAYHGRTWVTRSGVFVDRIASAWLIRRFIDTDARFMFVSEGQRRRIAGALRFDMFEGEFSHEGDRCTFETLLQRFGLADSALQAIAEIVHDIDLKDEKFGRDDTSGIERVLSSIAAAHADDVARLERGSQLFDDLYALFTVEAARAAASRAPG